MARRSETLEERIEKWPEQWREARLHYVEARAVVAKLELQLERAKAKEDSAGIEEGMPDEIASSGDPTLLKAEQHLLELEYQIQRATFEVERAKAAADVQTRNTAQKLGQKLTEAAVEARVKSDLSYIASQEKLLEVKHQHALARLERDQLRDQLRSQLRVRNFEAEEELESEKIRQLREQLEEAVEQLEKARIEFDYQKKVGQSLRMLAEVLKADSVVAAIVPAR